MDEVLRWLARAYAGELGAALAYRGHARSVRPGPERQRIVTILLEEIVHRAEAAALLAERGGQADARLARRIARVGRIAGILCHRTGHWAPMVGAALAEVINVGEYRRLGAAARAAGDEEVAGFARRARRLEAEHACWFIARAERHGGVLAFLARWLRARLDPVHDRAALPSPALPAPAAP